MKKTVPNSNFARYILENDHNINLDIKKDLEILNAQNNIYTNSVLELLISYINIIKIKKSLTIS